MIWRERKVTLIILAILLAANTIYFFTYRVRFQARLDDVDQELAQAQAQLAQAHTARLRAERTVQSYKQIEHDVQQVFDENWSTQRQRLTLMIAEVKHLALASGLTPASYTFEQIAAQTPEGAGRRRAEMLGATEVGIAFGVEGTYPQVRRLINLLELSRQFVIIDQIGLAASEGQNLTMSLHLKTLFRDEKSSVASKRL